MAIVDDDMKEDSVYPLLLDSLNSHSNEDAISPEDVAWADSCLNKYVDAHDTNWSSIKGALLEILVSQTGPANSSALENSAQPTADEVPFYGENVTTSIKFGRGSDEDEDLTDDDDDVGEVESIDISDDDEEDAILGNKKGRMRRKSRVENAFRPNYTEDVVKAENVVSGLDLSLTTYGEEPSSQDIFRVWDLGISDEQDDFTKQLNKALAEVPLQVQSNADDSTAWKDLMHVSVDDLIAGIGDLSLKHNTK